MAVAVADEEVSAHGLETCRNAGWRTELICMKCACMLIVSSSVAYLGTSLKSVDSAAASASDGLTYAYVCVCMCMYVYMYMHMYRCICICLRIGWAHLWCGMAWQRCGVVWYGMAWYGTVWCGVVWHGMVWYGVVWCGMAWYGVVWCGISASDELTMPKL